MMILLPLLLVSASVANSVSCAYALFPFSIFLPFVSFNVRLVRLACVDIAKVAATVQHTWTDSQFDLRASAGPEIFKLSERKHEALNEDVLPAKTRKICCVLNLFSNFVSSYELCVERNLFFASSCNYSQC